jgi:hypothetical protein
MCSMSFGIIHRFAGGTQEQYENSIKAVHRDGGKTLPEGQTLHVAGSTKDGWVIVAVHDSKASWESFRDKVLGPGLAGVENGLPGPPDETEFEVYKVQTG